MEGINYAVIYFKKRKLSKLWAKFVDDGKQKIVIGFKAAHLVVVELLFRQVKADRRVPTQITLLNSLCSRSHS